MKNLVPVVLLSHSVVSFLLGIVALQWVPELARISGAVCLLSGGFSLIWAVFGLKRRPQRGWAILTLSLTAFVMISQAVVSWIPAGDPVAGVRTMAIIASVMVVVTVAALMAVAHIGVTVLVGVSGSVAGAVGNEGTSVSVGSDSDSESEEWRAARRRAGMSSQDGIRIR